jgi:peroxiredoxin
MVLLESLNFPMGSPAIDFSLMGADGKEYSLADFEPARVLVIVFMCNHCPYVQAIWDRLVALQDKYQDKGVQFVGINPNFHPDYPEDSIEKMKEYVEQYGMNFPYLQDKTQEVAKDYQAQCTPDIYVFDSDRHLAYHGRLDDNWQNEGQVSRHDLHDALAAILAGEEIQEQFVSMGCSIKWQE